jgi:hypothetical protein
MQGLQSLLRQGGGGASTPQPSLGPAHHAPEDARLPTLWRGAGDRSPCIRSPQLQLVSDGHRGQCRDSRYMENMENGSHLIFCPDLPGNLRIFRDEIIQSIANESRVHPEAGSSAMES